MNPNTLFPHNLHAYNEIMQAFGDGKRKVCVEHATATGKSYLITAVSDHFERVVIIIPGEEVREQVKDTIIKLSPERSLMPDFITYQKLTEDNKAGLMESDYKNKYDLIVIDEYHHTGAKEWGKAIQTLIDNNADAKVLGTTATPERHSEGGRNMSEEFFDGNVASRLDLGTAWKRKVLMAADYIIAIEDSEKFHDEFVREIEESKLMDEQKSSFKDMVKQLQHDYDLKGKEPGVVKNHLRPEAKRVIVFSKNISQAKKDERKVKGWLKQAGFKIAGSYVIDSNVGSAERSRIRDAFQNNDFEGIKVMVAVNMFNEGVHVPDVDAVFFLRKTMSPTIHLQQMGRCMKLYKEGDHRSVIFDFCNNIKNVVKDDIEQLFKSERQSFDAIETKGNKTNVVRETEVENFPRGINYSAADYDLYEAFTRNNANVSWDKNIKEAKAFFEEHGRFPMPKDNRLLYQWALGWWRDTYLKNKELYQEKADKLMGVGFVYQTTEDRYDGMFMKNYEEAKAFFEEHGHFPTCKEKNNLCAWAGNWWRKYCLKPELYKEKADMLTAIGFEYQSYESLNDEKWMKNYKEAKAFYKEYGYFPKKDDNQKLSAWARQWWRDTYLKNMQKHQEKAEMLNAIGFTYQAVMDRFMEKYQKAKKFYEEHGRFPTSKDDRLIYHWAFSWWRRVYLENQGQHQKKAEMLTDIGFEYRTVDELNDNLWMKNYEEAKAFFEEHGHFPTCKEKNNLCAWAGNWWRKYCLKPELYKEKADMLTSIGFEYQSKADQFDGIFMKNYEEAKSFFEEHGHFPTEKECEKLYAWAGNWWRSSYLKSSEKYQEKAEMLIAIGFEYQNKDERYNKMWIKNYEVVRMFYKQYGHFPTPKENRLLYQWAMKWWRRVYLKNPELHQKKADMLKALGFEYKSNEDKFAEYYKQGKKFFDEHGRFPSRKENRTLYDWAKSWWKGTYYRNQKNNQRQADMLISIGFEYKGNKQ